MFRGTTTGMELVITEELIARQTPEAQAIIHALLARLAKVEAELEMLRRQTKGKTPQNSSLPPSTQHPHAQTAAAKTGNRRNDAAASPAIRNTSEPLIPTDECDDVAAAQADRMPSLWREAVWQRSGAAAASGLGIARDQAAGHRVSAASAGVSVLRRDDVCRLAARRAAGSVGATA